MKEVMKMKQIKISTAVKYGALITLIALLAMTTAVSAQAPVLNKVSPIKWTILTTSPVVGTAVTAGNVVLTGNNFVNALTTTVTFTPPSGVAITCVRVVNNQRRITATVPRWVDNAAINPFFALPVLTAPGVGQFQVNSPLGNSASVPFTVVAPKPRILSVTPQQINFRPPAGGASYDVMTIHGAGFVENSIVRFRGPTGTLNVPTVDPANGLRPGVWAIVDSTTAIRVFTWNGTATTIGANTLTVGVSNMITNFNDGYLFRSNFAPGAYTVSVINTPNQESNRRNVVLLESSNNPSLNPLTAIPARWSVTTAATGITTVTGGPFATGAQIWARNGSTFGNPLPPNPTNVPMATTYIDSRTLTCPNVTSFLYGLNPGPFGVAGGNVRVWVVQPAPGGGNGPVQNNWPLI
jgi:hypothetical protein